MQLQKVNNQLSTKLLEMLFPVDDAENGLTDKNADLDVFGSIHGRFSVI